MPAVDDAKSLEDPRIEYMEVFDLREHPLSVRDTVRDQCALNYCGLYGSNWMCPPALPPRFICELRINRFSKALLFRTSVPRDGPFDLEGMAEGGRSHREVTQAIHDELRASGEDFLVLSAGGCRLCPSCSYPDAPCRHPDRAVASIEGYCIDLDSFLIREGIATGSEEGSRHAFFGMVLFDPA
ncbi:MAG: DUF2284 domain-containing protein [Thermoplasmata archaeon]|nr:DUF2284 domain-containing protein [Thermoplasmata archaeon]